jgi:hypothetical protein
MNWMLCASGRAAGDVTGARRAAGGLIGACPDGIARLEAGPFLCTFSSRHIKVSAVRP